MNKRYFNFAIVIAILIFIVWFAYDSNNTDEPEVDNPANIEQNGDNNNDNNDNINNEPQDLDIKTDSGRFAGRIDNNFIEVRVSGVPDSIDPRVFMLSDEVKDMFDNLGLNEGDNIKFDYIIGDNDQQIIVKVEKI